MKKISFIILLTCLVSTAFSQSNVPGRFSLSTGFDIGGHVTYNTHRYKGTLIDEDTSGSATKLFQFNAHYSFAKWFSAGLGFRNGSYIEDPNDPDTKYESNTVGEFYLDTRFYFVNKDKFNMYGGLSFGRTNLHYNYTYAPIVVNADYSGGSWRLALGLNWYLSKYVGFWFNMDYAGRNFLMTHYDINASNFDLTDNEFRLLTKGLHLAFGICIKFKE